MASHPLRSSRRLGRIPLPGALLALTLLLALWLGVEALTTAGSYRRTTEAVLQDYARVALWRYVGEIEDELDDWIDTLLDGVDGDLRRFEPLPSPGAILRELDDAAREASCRRCGGLLRARAVVVGDPTTGQARVYPDTLAMDMRTALLAAPLAAAPEPPNAAAGGAEEGTRWDQGVSWGGSPGVDGVLVWGAARRPDGAARVVAVVFAPTALDEAFGRWFAAEALLPEPLGGGRANGELLATEVTTPGGVVLVAEGVPMAADGVGATLDAALGGLGVRMAVRPERADLLLIGGVPDDRLRALGLLLVVTLVVGALALVQLRREVRFQRLREDFVSGVSHELRTPLAQIRMFAELLESGGLNAPEERDRGARIIHREARRLSHLVENVLHFSGTRNGVGAAPAVEPVALAEVVREAVEVMEPLLAERGVEVAVECPPGLQVAVSRDTVVRVLVNLLDNALKYGPDGQTVTVTGVAAGDEATLVVADQGPGVPPSEHARIWEPYHRLPRDVRARRPGSGLGLSVVRDLAERAGGAASVTGAPGGGARFSITLPAA